MSTIEELNPYPSFRAGQREAIQGIIDAAMGGEKLIEYRAPTGAGKSLVLTVVARILETEGYAHAIYCSPQKQLVAQLSEDDHLKIPSLLGRGNYFCPREQVKSHSASDCFVPPKRRRFECPDCPYIAQKDRAMTSPLWATTLAKMLADRTIKKPDILIIDESQGLENTLLEQRSIQLPNRIKLNDLEESVQRWARDTSLEVMKQNELCERLYACIKRGAESDMFGYIAVDDAIKANKKLEKIERVARKAEGILQTIQTDPESFAVDPRTRAFKPIYGRQMFRELIAGIRLVIMSSGTPCTQLLADDYAKIVAPHPVDVERRRVYFLPCGKMNYQDREKTMDVMGAKIAELHRKYNRNTLVHCHSFKIADDLGNIVRDQGCRVKWVEQTGREASIQAWKDEDDAVFMSVACEEGLDLPGEKYPLNIIAKIPFLPYKSDTWTDRRKKNDNKLPAIQRWENVSVAIAIQQAAGRCTRGPTDFSKTYILDSSFEYFYRKNYMLFEDWFKAALCRVGGS